MFTTIAGLLLLASLAYIFNREAAIKTAWTIAIALACIVGILIILRVGLSPIIG